MKRYKDLSGGSGVVAYEIGEGSIRVKFQDGTTYLYTEASTGAAHIAEMHALARAGQGLSGYISRHVGLGYESKDR